MEATYELNEGKYLATLEWDEYEPNSGTIYVGGTSTKCVTIQLVKGDPVANLQEVRHDEGCSINGIGTIDLVRTVMGFTCKVCKWVKEFHVMDTSVVPCQKGVNLPLPEAHMFLHGTT